jgi:hypothetical protein
MLLKNEINLINACLLAIGETPIPADVDPNSLEEGTDASIARIIVQEVTREVLTQGWWFNTEPNFKFVPDDNKTINVPPTLLRIDTRGTEWENKIVFRKMLFYNLEEQTFFFDKPVIATAIWLVDYEDLPDTAYHYIALRSARRFQSYVVGDVNLYQYQSRDEEEAYIQLYREHLRFKKYTMVDSRLIQRSMNPTPQGF